MSRHIQISQGVSRCTPTKILFLAGRYYLPGTLVSMNVLLNVVPRLIKKVSSVADFDVGTCHSSVCEISIFSSRSAPANILNIR